MASARKLQQVPSQASPGADWHVGKASQDLLWAFAIEISDLLGEALTEHPDNAPLKEACRRVWAMRLEFDLYGGRAIGLAEETDANG